MTKKIFFVLVCFLLYYSCNSQIGSNEKSKGDKAVKESKEKQLIFDSKCVVIYMPDSLETLKLEKEKSEEELNAIDYDKSIAVEFLDNKDITVQVKDDRYYKFIKSDGEEIVIDKTKYKNWGIILFKPEKSPKVILLNELEGEYDNYFNQ